MGRRWLPHVLAVGAAVLILGPLLGPGVTIIYDMPWSPVPQLTPFALGVGTPAPRAAPGDAVVAVVGMVLGAGMAQIVVVGGCLVGAALGSVALARALRPGVSTAGAATVAIAAVWNPFVVERLAIGQWVVLLGYAVTPWLARVVVEGVDRRNAFAVPALLVVASLGGVNPLLMAVVVLMPGMVTAGRHWGRTAAAGLTAIGCAAVWALPSLAAGVRSAPAGAVAFGPRSDTPLGVWLSLLSGGGIWNPAAVPSSRGVMVGAVAATALALVTGALAIIAVRRRSSALFAPLVLSTGLVLVSTLPAATGVWARVIALPGMGMLRDSQKLLALWVVVLAVGAGLVVDALQHSKLSSAARGPLCAVVLLAPMAMLPSAAWGVSGRLAAVEVPTPLVSGISRLDALPRGVVGVLPWGQYRRYEWNKNRISLTLLPRMTKQVCLYDDSLPLRATSIPGEDLRAARVTRDLARGIDPITALRSAGVDYIALERRSGLAEPDLTQAGPVLIHTEDLLVVSLRAGTPVAATSGSFLRAGWAVTLLTWSVVLTGLLVSSGKSLRGERKALLRSAA